MYPLLKLPHFVLRGLMPVLRYFFLVSLDHNPTSEHQAIVARTVTDLITSRDLLSTASNLADGLRAFGFFLDQRPEQFPSNTALLHLAELVLSLNNFSFNSFHFCQVEGVVMSTHMGPSYAASLW
eukprot:g29712.t1